MVDTNEKDDLTSMVDAVLKGNAADARQKTFEVLNNKASDHIEELKKEYTSSVFDKEDL